MLRYLISNVNTEKPTGRLEAFSDGVFAIAITLLILNMEVPKAETLQGSLADFLIKQWPSYLALMVGFVGVLVCWVNHRAIFHYIDRSNIGLELCNAYLLFLVTIVPFATRLLAEYMRHSENNLVIRLYILTATLMSSSFYLVWTYAVRKKLVEVKHEQQIIQSMKHLYSYGIVYSTTAMLVTLASVPIGLVVFSPMLATFLFPRQMAVIVTHFVGKRSNRKTVRKHR